MIARKPEWLKVKLPTGENYNHLLSIVRERKLHTVCQEAMCPNIAECWGVGTATFMILGDTCTRGCRFCNVKTGHPNPIDPLEAFKLAKSVEELNQISEKEVQDAFRNFPSPVEHITAPSRRP